MKTRPPPPSAAEIQTPRILENVHNLLHGQAPGLGGYWRRCPAPALGRGPPRRPRRHSTPATAPSSRAWWRRTGGRRGRSCPAAAGCSRRTPAGTWGQPRVWEGAEGLPGVNRLQQKAAQNPFRLSIFGRTHLKLINIQNHRWPRWRG